MFLDQLRLNNFKIVRTSDVTAFQGGKQVNYQVFCQYSEKVGLIECMEYEIYYKPGCQPEHQLVSSKQIMLSKQIMQSINWDFFKKFQATSFIDVKTKQLTGSQLVFQLS